VNHLDPNSSLVSVTPRAPSPEEVDWIRSILGSNPAWASTSWDGLRIVAKCNCGCRSVVLNQAEGTQNPEFVGKKNIVGSAELMIAFNGKEDVVSVLLHYANGYLTLLEVVWYNFPAPVPTSWIELDRKLVVAAD
jgi:hypothetical protein